MNTISNGITKEKRLIQVKASSIMSAFTIIFLSCVVIAFTILNFNMIVKIRKPSDYTIVYSEMEPEEEQSVLKVNF